MKCIHANIDRRVHIRRPIHGVHNGVDAFCIDCSGCEQRVYRNTNYEHLYSSSCRRSHACTKYTAATALFHIHWFSLVAADDKRAGHCRVNEHIFTAQRMKNEFCLMPYSVHTILQHTFSIMPANDKYRFANLGIHSHSPPRTSLARSSSTIPSAVSPMFIENLRT